MAPEVISPSDCSPAPLSFHTRACAVGILLVSLACALLLSHYKLFWEDEVFQWYADTKPTAAAVFSGQLRSPFSFEPPAFHLLLHFMDKLFPRAPELSSRIISMLSLLVTEYCVFRITYRLIRREAAALLAMALPFFFVTFDYAPEARVYSLFVTTFALSLLFYQSAIEPTKRSRALALVGLYLSLTAGMLIHYYGLFLPLPLVAGEIVRTVRQRRVDLPVTAVLLAAFTSFSLDLPFLPALHQFRSPYEIPSRSFPKLVQLAYAWFVEHVDVYRQHSFLGPHTEQMIDVVTIVSVIALIVFAASLLRTRNLSARPMVAVIGAGFLLPVFDIALAHAASHAFVPRYSLPSVVPLSILIALLCSRFFHSRWAFTFLFSAVFIASCVYAVRHMRIEHKRSNDLEAQLTLTPALRAEVTAQPDHHIYVQNIAKFLPAYFYAGPGLKQYLVNVESLDRELYWMHQSTIAPLSRNLGITTTLPTALYESIAHPGQPHLFLIYNNPQEEWIGKELIARKDCSQQIGEFLGGTLYRVTFSPCSTLAR